MVVQPPDSLRKAALPRSRTVKDNRHPRSTRLPLGHPQAWAARGERSGGQPDDLYFVLRSELEQFVENPAGLAELVAQRRATRDALGERVPPFVFEGEMPRADTWPRRDEAGSITSVVVGEVLEGLGGCPGIAEGRAKVVTSAQIAVVQTDVMISTITDLVD